MNITYRNETGLVVVFEVGGKTVYMGIGATRAQALEDLEDVGVETQDEDFGVEESVAFLLEDGSRMFGPLVTDAESFFFEFDKVAA